MTKEEQQDMLSAIKEDQEAKKSKRKTWSPPSDQEGDFKVRILPPLKRKNEKLFYSFYKNHWVGQSPYLCLNQKIVDKNGETHLPEECPICNYVKKLYKVAGNDKECDEAKLASQISARDRYLYRVAVRGSEDETMPVLWESSKTMFSAIVGFMTTDNPEKNYGIIVDPLEGRDFIISKKGKGSRSNYDQSVPSNSQSQMFPEKEKIQKALINAEKLEYNSIFEFSTAETMEKALKEFIAGNDSDTAPVQKAVKQTETVIEHKKKEEVVEESSESDDAIDDLLKDLF